jgi:membrane associated rhomboid family serine protease
MFYRSALMPEGVKWLLIINVALFVLYFLATNFGYASWFTPFGLVPGAVVFRGKIWQLFTYQFLHDPYGFGHILWNMLPLWMFGKDLEAVWGRKRFLQFYFLCGTGAGVCVVVANLLFGNPNAMTIGASGAIYGLLLAFGMLFPDRELLFSFLFPIKAKYFVMIVGAIAFLSSIAAPGGGVSHFAHLGGMVIAYFYLKSSLMHRDLLSSVRYQYKEWKLRRAKKNFQVYMRKQSNRDIH